MEEVWGGGEESVGSGRRRRFLRDSHVLRLIRTNNRFLTAVREERRMEREKCEIQFKITFRYERNQTTVWTKQVKRKRCGGSVDEEKSEA